MRDDRSSQNRLRAAAKMLFARKGYEATTIADIVHAAGTSHSQFLKYYSGKQDLRNEIIDQQWSELTKAILLAISGLGSGVEKLKLALNMFISFLESEPALRTILLLEQTACRDAGSIVVSRDFREFITILDEIMTAMKSEGELLERVIPQAFRSALMGCIEGMMRDSLLADSGLPAGYSVEQVRETVALLVDAACHAQRPAGFPEFVPSQQDIPLGRSPEDEWIRYYLRLGETALNPSELS